LSAEPAKEALDLYYANRGKKPVVGGGVPPPHRAPNCGLAAGGVPTEPKTGQNKKKTPPVVNKKPLLQKKIYPKNNKPPTT
ncbi:hypothetical protein ACVGV3_00065, partial [Enterobacter intestinihominis]